MHRYILHFFLEDGTVEMRELADAGGGEINPLKKRTHIFSARHYLRYLGQRRLIHAMVLTQGDKLLRITFSVVWGGRKIKLIRAESKHSFFFHTFEGDNVLVGNTRESARQR